MGQKREVGIAAQIFVTIVFLVLALSFWASTATLIYEFRFVDWPSMLVAHSHLFLFFPVFGTVLLALFFLTPSIVLTDFYWRHVKFIGRTRFLIGLAAVAGLSVFFAWLYAGAERRAVWEISPAALIKDQEQTPRSIEACREQRLGGVLRDFVRETQPGRDVDQGARPCVRRPILETLSRLTENAAKRGGLSDFARSCVPDQLVEEAVDEKALRYCFPAGVMLNASACCRAQRVFDTDVKALATAEATRSLTSRVEEIAIGFKAFFIIVLAVVGFLLAFWQSKIAVHYPTRSEHIIRCVLIGSMLILLWPAMDYSYQLTSDVLFGRMYRGLPKRITLLFSALLVLALLINVIFFIRRASGNMPSLSGFVPMLSGCFTVIAYVSYDHIANFTSWFVGPGLDPWKLLSLAVLCLLAIALTYGPFKLPLDELALDMGGGRDGKSKGTKSGAAGGTTAATTEPVGSAPADRNGPQT